jgi:hypothetical protein
MRAERINSDQLNNEKRASVDNIISGDCLFIVSPIYAMMILARMMEANLQHLAGLLLHKNTEQQHLQS